LFIFINNFIFSHNLSIDDNDGCERHGQGRSLDERALGRPQALQRTLIARHCHEGEQHAGVPRERTNAGRGSGGSGGCIQRLDEPSCEKEIGKFALAHLGLAALEQLEDPAALAGRRGRLLTAF
jgi:hypothetical protein